jgi:hypothetical protein
MDIKIELKGRGIASFTAAAKDLASPKAKAAARMALNDTGKQVNTRVKRILVKQTGLKYGAIQKGVRQQLASNANLEFRITGTGKHFGLVDFNARQGKRGVSASPWATRRMFKHTFIVAKLGGQVFVRTGKERLPVKKLWGPSIPREMVRDEVPVVFESMARTILPVQVARQFARLMPK